VVGTTSMPVILPCLSSLAKNSAKAVATNAAKSQVQKLVSNAKNLAPAMHAQTQHATALAPSPQMNNKKLGFFHKLFGRKDKQVAAANNSQLASQKARY
jgi:hypothetical protein